MFWVFQTKHRHAPGQACRYDAETAVGLQIIKAPLKAHLPIAKLRVVAFLGPPQDGGNVAAVFQWSRKFAGGDTSR